MFTACGDHRISAISYPSSGYLPKYPLIHFDNYISFEYVQVLTYSTPLLKQ